MYKFKCWKKDKEIETELQKQLKKKYYNKDIKKIIMNISISAIVFCILEFAKLLFPESRKLDIIILYKGMISLIQMFIPVYIVEVLRLNNIYKQAYYEYKGNIDCIYENLEYISMHPMTECESLIKDIKNYQINISFVGYWFKSLYGMNAYNCFINRLYNLLKSRYDLCLAYESNKKIEEKFIYYKNIEKQYYYIKNNKLCNIEKFNSIIERVYNNSKDLVNEECIHIQKDIIKQYYKKG